MHTFYLLLKRDFVLGINIIKKSLFGNLVLASFIFLYPIYFFYTNIPKDPVNFWDIIGENFGGIPIELVKQQHFKLPYGWIYLQLFGATIIGTYIKDDIFLQSSFLRVRTRATWNLWISKLIFSITIICLLYILLLALTFVILNLNLNFTQDWTTYSQNLMRFSHEKFTYKQVIIYSIILNILGTICVTIMYAMFSLIIQPIYGYIICAVIVVSSIFSDNFIFIGNTSMFFRQTSLSTVYTSMCIQLVLITIFSVIGAIYLQKTEIIQETN
ncbi:hypothetical protein [Bacillus mycoides]